MPPYFRLPGRIAQLGRSSFLARHHTATPEFGIAPQRHFALSPEMSCASVLSFSQAGHSKE
jgi:hypothetical protein